MPADWSSIAAISSGSVIRPASTLMASPTDLLAAVGRLVPAPPAGLESLPPAELGDLYRYGYKGDLPGTTRLSGFQHCNLTTINGHAAVSETAFYKACLAATAIGTIQAAERTSPRPAPPCSTGLARKVGTQVNRPQ